MYASCSNVAPSDVPWPAVCSRMTIVLPRRRAGEKLQQAIGDEIEAGRFAAQGVAARMEHDAEQTQRFGAVDLVGHRLERLTPQRRIGGREVDQVAGMRYDRVEAGRLDLRAKLANLRRGDLAAAPLVRVLAEDLKRFAAMDDGALDRARQSSGDRHVRA